MSYEEKAGEMSLPRGQKWLLEKIQAVGYPVDMRGVCYGFSLACAEAVFLGKEELIRFKERLALIHAIPLSEFKKKLAWCDLRSMEKIKNGEKPKENTLYVEINKEGDLAYCTRTPEGETVADVIPRAALPAGALMAPLNLGVLKGHTKAILNITSKKGHTRSVLSEVDGTTAEEWDQTQSEIRAFFDKIHLLQQSGHTHPELFGGCDLHFVSAWPAPPDTRDAKSIPFVYPCYVYVRASISEESHMPGQLFYMASAEKKVAVEMDTDTQSLVESGLENKTAYRRLDRKEASKFGTFFQEFTPKSQESSPTFLMRSNMMETRNTHVSRADHFIGAYTSGELETYFESLARYAEYGEPIVLQLESVSHAIAVSYDSTTQKWTLIDANRAEQLLEEIDSAEEIAEAIFSSLRQQEHAIFRTTMLTTDQTLPAPFLAWKKSLDTSGMHTITPEKARFIGSNGASLLQLAATNCDIMLVQHLSDSREKPRPLGRRWIARTA